MLRRIIDRIDQFSEDEVVINSSFFDLPMKFQQAIFSLYFIRYRILVLTHHCLTDLLLEQLEEYLQEQGKFLLVVKEETFESDIQRLKSWLSTTIPKDRPNGVMLRMLERKLLNIFCGAVEIYNESSGLYRINNCYYKSPFNGRSNPDHTLYTDFFRLNRGTIFNVIDDGIQLELRTRTEESGVRFQGRIRHDFWNSLMMFGDVRAAGKVMEGKHLIGKYLISASMIERGFLSHLNELNYQRRAPVHIIPYYDYPDDGETLREWAENIRVSYHRSRSSFRLSDEILTTRKDNLRKQINETSSSSSSNDKEPSEFQYLLSFINRIFV